MAALLRVPQSCYVELALGPFLTVCSRQQIARLQGGSKEQNRYNQRHVISPSIPCHWSFNSSRRPSSGRQFLAVLRKNALLQTRSGRSFLGISGMAALVLEILTPAAFFLLMCLPKYYFDVKPTPIPTQLFQSMDLDNPHWANKYQGERISALILDNHLVLNMHRNTSLLPKRCFLALILKVAVKWMHTLRRACFHTCHACHSFLPACTCMACEIATQRGIAMHAGPAAAHGFRATLLYAPNDSSTAEFVEDFAHALACPVDPSKREQLSGTFYSLFRPMIPAAQCAEQAACMQQPACWQHLVSGPDARLRGYATQVRRQIHLNA